MLGEVQLDELAEAAGVVVIYCLGIAEGLQNWAGEGRDRDIVTGTQTTTAPQGLSLSPPAPNTLSNLSIRVTTA